MLSLFGALVYEWKMKTTFLLHIFHLFICWMSHEFWHCWHIFSPKHASLLKSLTLCLQLVFMPLCWLGNWHSLSLSLYLFLFFWRGTHVLPNRFLELFPLSYCQCWIGLHQPSKLNFYGISMPHGSSSRLNV